MKKYKLKDNPITMVILGLTLTLALGVTVMLDNPALGLIWLGIALVGLYI